MNRDSIIGINSRIMSRLSSHFLCSRLRDHKKKTVVLSSGSDVKVKVAPMSTINRSFLPKFMHIIKIDPRTQHQRQRNRSTHPMCTIIHDFLIRQITLSLLHHVVYYYILAEFFFSLDLLDQ